jgi:hypothetical protein
VIGQSRDDVPHGGTKAGSNHPGTQRNTPRSLLISEPFNSFKKIALVRQMKGQFIQRKRVNIAAKCPKLVLKKTPTLRSITMPITPPHLFVWSV